ncbi:hypothetical protein ACQPZJ_09950 [Actinoplanes sp. CA-054009]
MLVDADGVGDGDVVGAVGVGTGGCSQWHSVFVGLTGLDGLAGFFVIVAGSGVGAGGGAAIGPPAPVAVSEPAGTPAPVAVGGIAAPPVEAGGCATPRAACDEDTAGPAPARAAAVATVPAAAGRSEISDPSPFTTAR